MKRRTKPGLPATGPRGQLHLVIITGLSGSGKGSVVKVFEDSGYYCVDNLPVDLLPRFVELAQQSGEIERVACVVDIREGRRLGGLPAMLRALRAEPLRLTLLFLEANDEVIMRRFSETRRPHPLAGEREWRQLGDARSASRRPLAGSAARAPSDQQERPKQKVASHSGVREGIAVERKALARIRDAADLVVDTSKFNVHELRDFIQQRVIRSGLAPRLQIALTSFGFRNGLPSDADLVFDVRFLPNPNYVAALRPLTGRDRKVAAYIRAFPQTGEFVRRIRGLLAYLIPHYMKEGKSYLNIAVGCTGGRHRSVYIAETLGRELRRLGFQPALAHRDL
ncbi:MAG: RNase adapter RapZ [Terriglobales bacterium]